MSVTQWLARLSGGVPVVFLQGEDLCARPPSGCPPRIAEVISAAMDRIDRMDRMDGGRHPV